jgi:NADH-quinone oxidoreductase subunit H
MFFIIFKFIIYIIPILVSIAYVTLLERKVLASIQKRKGPNVVGFLGLLQPFADGLKLILKENILPFNTNKLIFILSPILFFFFSLLN